MEKIRTHFSAFMLFLGAISSIFLYLFGNVIWLLLGLITLWYFLSEGGWQFFKNPKK